MQPGQQSPEDRQNTAIGSWEWRLEEACTPEAVVEVTRDFLALWSPEEIARLPEECRPAKLVDANDVTEYAFILVRRSCADDRMSDRELLRMATFFTRASLRLSQIQASADRALSETSEQ